MKKLNLIGTLVSNAETVKNNLNKMGYKAEAYNIMNVDMKELDGTKILLFAGPEYSMDKLMEDGKIADKMAETILQAEPARINELKPEADMTICVDYLDTEEVTDMVDSYMNIPEDVDFAHTTDKQRSRKRRKAEFRIKTANAHVKKYRNWSKSEALKERKTVSNRKTRRVLKKEIFDYNFDGSGEESGIKTSSRNNISKKCIRGRYMD